MLVTSRELETERAIYDPSLVLYLPLHQLDGSSFMSRDAYGHLCSVTGALWTPQGRSFDGSDDFIDCGAGASLNIRHAISIVMWVNIQAQVLNDYLLDKNLKYRFYQNPADAVRWLVDTADGAVAADTASLSMDRWYHIVGTYDKDGGSDNVKIYRDTILDATSTQTGDIGDTAGEVLKIGTHAAQFGEAVIGEVMVYSRALTPLEIQHNYLATKWRYR